MPPCIKLDDFPPGVKSDHLPYIPPLTCVGNSNQSEKSDLSTDPTVNIMVARARLRDL